MLILLERFLAHLVLQTEEKKQEMPMRPSKKPVKPKRHRRLALQVMTRVMKLLMMLPLLHCKIE